MDNQKNREFRLTKKAKYGLASMVLVGALGVGVASFFSDNNVANDDKVVNVNPSNPSEDDTPVVVIEEEKLAKPFIIDAAIKTYFFDINDNSDTQKNALIYYNGMYTPSVGVDYFYNNQAFDVNSVFSGTVIEKKVDPLYGATVYIKSDDNPTLVAVYASLSDITVSVGDKVKQNQVIAKAGNNTINSNLGNHLNFSLLKDNKNIDPLDYYTKLVKDI